MQGTQITTSTTRRGTVDVHLVITGGRMDIHETFSFVIGADAGGEHLRKETRR